MRRVNSDRERKQKNMETATKLSNNKSRISTLEGVEGLSGPRRGRVPQIRRAEQLSAKDSGEQKIHEKRAKSFHEAHMTRTHERSQQAETRETYAAQRR